MNNNNTAFTHKNVTQLYKIFIFLMISFGIGSSMTIWTISACSPLINYSNVMSQLTCIGFEIFIGMTYILILAVVWGIIGLVILTFGTLCKLFKKFLDTPKDKPENHFPIEKNDGEKLIIESV